MPRATASGEPALSEPQRRARGLAGVGLLGLAAARLRWAWALSLPTSLAAGWLGASHLVAAAIGYRGCPELGAIPTLVLGRRVETRCGPWQLLDARLGLETPTEGEDRDGIACACR